MERIKNWHYGVALPRCVAKKVDAGEVKLTSFTPLPRLSVEPVAPSEPVFDFANPTYSPRYPNDPAGNEGAHVYSWARRPPFTTSWGEAFGLGEEEFGYDDPRRHWNADAFAAYVVFQRTELVPWRSEMATYEGQMTLYNAEVKVYQMDLNRYVREIEDYETKVREAMKVRLFLSGLAWGFLAVLLFLLKAIPWIIMGLVLVVGVMFASGMLKGPKVDGNLEKKPPWMRR